MNVGARIRELRELKGLSGSTLAKKVGLTQSQIAKIETGVSKPSLDSLEKICDVLEISLSNFFATNTGESSQHITELIDSLSGVNPEEITHLVKFIDGIKKHNH